VDESSPLVDARLPDGSLVDAASPPVAVDGPLLSIRRLGRDRKWIPAWSMNDDQLRHVLAQRTWTYLCNAEGGVVFGKNNSGGIVPYPLVSNREALQKMLDTLMVNMRNRALIYNDLLKHQERVSAHGFLQLQAATIYRAYRLRQRAPDIAKELGVTPEAVRQWLLRANYAARMLGYECFESRHWSRGKKRPYKLFQKADALRLAQEKPSAKRANDKSADQREAGGVSGIGVALAEKTI
jgi:hypothetical protein